MKILVSNKHDAITTHRGSVLILVLIVVASMTLLTTSLVYRIRVEMRMADSYAQRTQAYYLALGGVERVKAHLGVEEIAAENIARRCSLNTTATAEGLWGSTDDSLYVDKRLWYCLRDEMSYFDINKSDPAAWERVHNLSKKFGAGILDWRDNDDQVSSEGAEADFYEMREPPYTAKNSNYVILRELLYVADVSPSVYAGEDLNRNRNLDGNENDGSLQIPFDNGDGELNLGLTDIFTVYGSEKININTAPAWALSALPGLNEQAAQAVIEYRKGPDGWEGTEDDLSFAGAEDLADLRGLSRIQRDLLTEYCCFVSRYFRIFSRASLDGGIDCSLMATALIADDGIKIVYLERLPQ